ncbi:MAG: twin-arginine translocase TatA/TatE family subunit [Solirubrobacterales bacterium]|nr:twin-arginine translocase TatA/TatE family subunit [Solirubrobacterales bacterium]
MTGLLSPGHIVVLLVVLLLVFGTKRVPELGRSLGTGLREFKQSVGSDAGELRAIVAATPEPVERAAGVPVPAVSAAAPPASTASSQMD